MTLTKAAPLTVALHRVFWAAPVLLVVVFLKGIHLAFLLLLEADCCLFAVLILTLVLSLKACLVY